MENENREQRSSCTRGECTAVTSMIIVFGSVVGLVCSGIGAAVGAVTGILVHATGTGAAIGAAVGGGVGFAGGGVSAASNLQPTFRERCRNRGC